MALKQVMLTQKINKARTELKELLERETAFIKRSSELEADIAEAQTDEEVAAVEQAVAEAEADGADIVASNEAISTSSFVKISPFSFYFYERQADKAYPNVPWFVSPKELGSWVDTGAKLPGTAHFGQLAIDDDSVYILGGYGGNSDNAIYRAPTNNPLSWVDTGAKLPGALAYSQLAFINDYAYLFGGTANVIYRAPRNNLTSWVNTGNTLPGNWNGCALEVNYSDGYAVTNVIYRAPLSNPLDWSDSGLRLPGILRGSHMAVIENHIYLFGGYNTKVSNVIYRAPLS